MGARWAMAEEPIVLSFMQPIITFMPNDLASPIILIAGVIPLHFVSLILMP
jgi:hypothetical protein